MELLNLPIMVQVHLRAEEKFKGLSSWSRVMVSGAVCPLLGPDMMLMGSRPRSQTQRGVGKEDEEFK